MYRRTGLKGEGVMFLLTDSQARRGAGGAACRVPRVHTLGR